MNKQEFETIKIACDNLAKKQGIFEATEEAIKKVDRFIGEGATSVSLSEFSIDVEVQAFKTFLQSYSTIVDNETKDLAKKIKIT